VDPPGHLQRHRHSGSLDTLSPETFVTLARRDRLADVLAGLSAATAAGLAPVKVNAVLMRGVNDHEAPSLLRFGLDADTSSGSSSRCRWMPSAAGGGPT
jgi:molybdenum cofactor biosynthesis enzyme MoaA